jgi:hypothetical protein
MASERESFELRSFRRSDEDGALALLDEGFGGWSPQDQLVPRDFFRWKMDKCPFGSAKMLVADANGTIVGFLALLPWQFLLDGATVDAVREADVVVKASSRHSGVFGALSRASFGQLPSATRLTWNNPNQLSIEATLRRGKLPVTVTRFVRARPAVRRLSRRDVARTEDHPVSAALQSAADVSWLERAVMSRSRLSTPKSAAYLNWRYGTFEKYRAVHDDAGIAIFEVQDGRAGPHCEIAELLVREGGRRAAARLLRQVESAAGASVLSCNFASPADALAHGFIPRGSATVTYRPSPLGGPDDDLRAASWAMSRGDLDLL